MNAWLPTNPGDRSIFGLDRTVRPAVLDREWEDTPLDERLRLALRAFREAWDENARRPKP